MDLLLTSYAGLIRMHDFDLQIDAAEKPKECLSRAPSEKWNNATMK
jgi:hypothetical protein